MEQITIEGLYQKLKEKITTASNLEEFYIGRTDDLEQRRKIHLQKDKLPFTLSLAKGKKDIISKAEEYLQSKYMDNPKCSNERIGGGSKGGILYISYKNSISNMKTIDDVHDEEFEWENEYELINRKEL